MSQHTKDAWCFEESPESQYGDFRVRLGKGGYVHLWRRADARLIAAAPEMYEVLLAIQNGEPGALSRIRAILAKVDA